MIPLPRRLKANGVLGINRRNTHYVLPHNQREYYPLADDKVLTKQIAAAAGAAVPELYGVIETHRNIRTLADIVANREEFVIKPAHGSQGKGIVVVTRSGAEYQRADGAVVSEADMAFHISNILSGVFALGGQPDKAIIEYRVKFDPIFEDVTFQGVPDVRIIIFYGVPIMAMVRLPTRASSGKANLHKGAIGAGIGINSGRTLSAVSGNSIVTEHPDTGRSISGLEIPHWRRLLEIAARTYEMTHLGYQGVDIVLDRDRGPLILELNARPGLNIQIANRAGLAPRLEAVLRDRSKIATVEDRVAYCQQHF